MSWKNKNDFTKEANKVKSRFKLWVKYRPEFVNEKLPETKVYYSYERAENHNYGYNKLISLVMQNKLKIKIAILYDNHTGKQLERY